MLQKINFTGRIDLPMDVLDAHIGIEGSRSILFLEWNLSGFKFDKDAEIWIEIRRAGSYEYRREFLTNFKRGNTEARIDVSNMTDPMNLRLRLKVILDKQGKRLLIGNLDNFVPRVPKDQSKQKGFLKIIKDDSLEVPWCVRVHMGEPFLVISGKKHNYAVLKEQTPVFIPSILPEVVRQIHIWAVNDRDRENPEVYGKWKNFLIGLGGNEKLFDSDLDEFDDPDSTHDELILENTKECAAEFARRNSIIDQVDILHQELQGESYA
jgi:hypothetical protein